MTAFGAFGKIPALGDFFRVTPPPGFVEAWDPWLQSRLLDLRETLGEGWRNAYLGAPIWRFTLSPGTAGAAAALGVLMPSVDRVGRDFPLTLVAGTPGAATAFGLHAAGEGAFAALEDLALATLGDGIDLDRLTACLASVALPDAAMPRTLGRGPGHLALATGGPAGAALLDALTGGWTRPSVWSAVLDGATRVMVSEGLPGPERARALFDLAAPLWHGGAAPAGTVA